MESKLIKGTLQTIILSLLEKEGRMYGYEITKKVRDLSAEQILLTEGALYPALHKLEAEGYLLVEKVPVGKRVRKYYTLSPQGKKAAARKTGEFEEFVQAMYLVLRLQPKT